jgi:hypothetical protein
MTFSEDWENLIDRFAESFGEPYTLQRGIATATVEAQAWDQMYEVQDHEGLLTTINGRDLLIAADAYLVSSEAVEPRIGDLWTDSTGRTWEVMPLAGKPAFERHGSEWLVRCKETS